jgi:hypothetical protein
MSARGRIAAVSAFEWEERDDLDAVDACNIHMAEAAPLRSHSRVTRSAPRRIRYIRLRLSEAIRQKQGKTPAGG